MGSFLRKGRQDEPRERPGLFQPEEGDSLLPLSVENDPLAEGKEPVIGPVQSDHFPLLPLSVVDNNSV